MTATVLDELARRLSAASIEHRAPPAGGIAWDDPQLRLERGDPRHQLPTWDPLTAWRWYAEADDATRSDVGLARTVSYLDAGVAFERALQVGLLRYCDHGHPSPAVARYLCHEIAEEAQHSLMFLELIERTGVAPPARTPADDEVLNRVAELGVTSPPLLLLAAVAGEEALDHCQLATVRDSAAHPLLQAVCRAHRIEEARHLSFARAYLRAVVPGLSLRERRLLGLRAPTVIGWTLDHLFRTPAGLAAGAQLGRDRDDDGSDAVDAAGRRLRLAAARRVHRLCAELGLVEARAHWWVDLGLAPGGPAADYSLGAAPDRSVT